MTTTYEPITSGGTVTSWIPLTTVFTPPASCQDLFFSSDGALNAFDPDYGVNINPSVHCMPPPVTQWWDEDSGPGDKVVYSLGPMTCPFDWGASASTRNTSALTSCCAPGYSVDDATDTWCFSSATSGVVVTFMNFTTISSRTSSSLVTSTLRNSTILWAAAIVGWNMQETTAPSSRLSSTIPSPTTPVSHPSTIPSSSSSSSSSGLSTGAAAGIGVGVGVGVIGLAAAAIALFLARRRRARAAATTDPVAMEQPNSPPPPQGGYGQEQYYDPPQDKSKPVELGNTGPSEMGSEIHGQAGNPAELGGTQWGQTDHLVELDAT